MKKHLTDQQEFEIMKIVIDKFLLLTLFILIFGFYQLSFKEISMGLVWLLTGSFLLIIFVVMLKRKFMIIK